MSSDILCIVDKVCTGRNAGAFLVFKEGCEDMLSIYTGYCCSKCKKEFVLLSDDVEIMKGYLVCPYCSSQRVNKQKITDSLKECMSHRKYKKENGVTKQK